MLEYEGIDESSAAWRFFCEACVSVFIIILIILLLFGAGSLPKIGQRLGEKSRKPVRQAKWVMAWATGTEEEAIEAEREYGRECAGEFVAQFPGEVSDRDRELVDSIGTRLAAAVKDRRRRFSFKAVPGPIANAYALPGGFVFITAPLLELCGRDPDEIAFFLGHEVGHVVCGHARDQLAASAILNAVGSRLASVGALLRDALGKGYSRSLELDADREAVRFVRAAGFDPRAARRALGRLTQSAADNPGLAAYFSTHPAIRERIRALDG